MRKSLVIVLGCIVLGGLVMATPTAQEPPLPNETIEITCNPDTGAVNKPWFVLDISDKNKVSFHNATKPAQTVHIIWQGNQSPISWQYKQLDPGATTGPEATDKTCPGDWPENEVCRAYWYIVVCPANREEQIIDPGGGIRP